MDYIVDALKIGLVIVFIVVLVKVFIPGKDMIDVTDLRNATAEQVEKTLGVKCNWDPNMSSKIYQYSHSGIAVKGDVLEGIGVVYMNSVPAGLRVENSKYKLFNIEIGKSRVGMESAMTFSYSNKFEINESRVEDLFTSDRKDFPIFYCDWEKNECIVVSCEKSTGIIMSVTYFNNAKKVTEKLEVSGRK